MTYIYDILLNFEKDFFDFFEWNNNDKITHIKKIPLIKISSHEFDLFKNSKIRFKKFFLRKIYNKTEQFSPKKDVITYAFLISNGYEVIALKLNKNGINTYKSSLLFDEEDEITNIAFKLEKTQIEYVILKKQKTTSFKTRKEKTQEKNIINSLNNLYKNKENNKMQFLYLECFNTKEKNLKKIYTSLKKEVLKNSKNTKKINDFFKLTKNRG